MNEADGKVLISYKAGLNEKDPTGFRAFRVPFFRLANMVKSAGQYSSVQFREGYRCAKNAIPFSELIILDYDAGVTLCDAAEMFRQYIGLIATTRSHQKEKHGVICDRFRVILPTLRPVKLDAVEFSKMMSGVINRYSTDKACKDISRMYYGNPESEVSFLDGYQLFDWEPFYQSALDKERQRQQQYRKPVRYSLGDRDVADLDKATCTYWARNFAHGRRNSTVFTLGVLRKNAGAPMDILYSLNGSSGCPLTDDEMNRVVRNVSKYGTGGDRST
ncbi:MAG: hypothetical protein WCI23_12290 [Chlorobiaceae bacterium]